MANREVITPAIRSYVEQCSQSERRTILAYCCYLSFADKQLRRMEVDFVRAMAELMKIDAGQTATMARKVRRGRLSIKKPKSSAAKSLLFHLALKIALSDDEVDARERAAIDKLGQHLGLTADQIESELARLTNQSATAARTKEKPVVAKTLPAKPPVVQPPPEPSARPPIPAEPAKGFFANLLDMLVSHVVLDDFEADLFVAPHVPGARKQGELEYTRTRDGRRELEIELKEAAMQGRNSVSIVIAGRHVCDIRMFGPRYDRTFTSDELPSIPQVALGDAAEVQHNGQVILRGQFERN